MPASVSPANLRKSPSAARSGLACLNKLRPFGVALGVLGLDQITKALALKYLAESPTYPILPGIFHLTLVHNTGVAFGLFQGFGLWVTLLTLAALIGFYWINSRSGAGFDQATRVVLGLILGGAAGNLIDRIRFGGVIDFLDFRVWPVFNVADSCITLAALWMTFRLLIRKS